MNDDNRSNPSFSREGINIHKAMEILSLRASNHSHDHDHHHHHHHDENVTHTTSCQENIPDEVKGMGQRIELYEKEGEKLKANMEDAQRELQSQQVDRHDKIKKELKNLTFYQLLQTILKTQQERIATYRTYNDGLKTMIKTGNITSYPLTCANATSSFAVLSETIRTIQSILKLRLEQDSNNDYHQVGEFLQQLQRCEKEKLHRTAALHLEQIRQVGATHDNNQVELRLLQDSIATLRKQIANNMEEINDIMDEIRLIMLEQQVDD